MSGPYINTINNWSRKVKDIIAAGIQSACFEKAIIKGYPGMI